ncbi:leucine-rich repeat and calponin homology domain-containing protein isoform X2 [Planococcus citri]|uniref:leucine-rich repeat and calponin homology domain-containing protein isoform X2 n=1 Tax=Planococcus citri TaxID=170843 RepID=UPI0031F78FF9
MSRSVERVLEEAHLSGDLKLNGRKLKEFPSTDKYDLHDTVFADLSRNRFSELPVEITRFWCLEHLNLYHNTLRSIPDSITYLQSLVYLDISHNQLSVLPSSIFHLPLEILLASNNKLQSLPSELGYCKTLAELDVSCNQISRLPAQLGVLTLLRSLNIRCNMLLEIPIELTYLRLTRLDMSRNRIASLPIELKNMSSTLEILRLADNPLMAPPAVVCARGMVHVFKWLELRCSKQENKKSSFQGETKNKKKYDLPKNQFNDSSSIDWPFLSSDISIPMYSPLDEKLSRTKSPEKRGSDLDIDKPLNPRSGSTKSLDSQTLSMNKMNMKNQMFDNQVGEKCHLQTYREYKESLRQQRTVDSVYKCSQRELSNGNSKSPILQESVPIPVPVSVPVTEPKITQSSDMKVKSSPIKEPPPSMCEKLVVKSLTRTKSKNLNDIPFDKMQFTMRREYEKAKEEAELIRQLRITIESRLKVVLPEDLSSALNDGVVLCHFANHIMPHSVASIHVPSPTVPKLTTARCRRNVDNFLEACRKIGIEDELLCNRNDILEMKENILPTVAVIVCKLLKKSNQLSLNSQHRKLLNVESFDQNHINASGVVVLSRQRIIFEKFSTALCLLIFVSVNLLLYICPIPS